MSSVSDCPSCGQKVSIPQGIDAGTTVRCPLCEGEFPLDRALAAAVPAPPELVPVARISADTSNGLTVADEDPDQVALERPAGTEQPASGQEAAVPPAAESAEDGYALAGELRGEAEAEAEGYDFGDGLPAAGPGLGAAGAAAPWRSRQQEPSLAGQLGKFVGIVVGAFLGIAVAYLVMSWISPGRFDYLDVWGRAKPPGANHTGPSGPASAPGKAAQDDPENTWAELPAPGSAKPAKK